MKKDQLYRRLEGAWRRQRKTVHLNGVAWVLLLAAASSLVLYGLDWLLRLPRGGRWLLLLIAAGLIGWQLMVRWYRKLQDFDPIKWAVRVEDAFPQLNTLLISYVEIACGAGKAPVAREADEGRRGRLRRAPRPPLGLFRRLAEEGEPVLGGHSDHHCSALLSNPQPAPKALRIGPS